MAYELYRKHYSAERAMNKPAMNWPGGATTVCTTRWVGYKWIRDGQVETSIRPWNQENGEHTLGKDPKR